MNKRLQFILVTGSSMTEHIGIFVLSIILARYFSQETYGTYLQIMLICNFAVFFSPFGLPSSFYYFLPRVIEKQRMILTTFLIIISIGAFTATIITLSINVVGDWFNNPNIATFAIFILFFIFFQIPVKIFESLMISTQQVGTYSALNFSFNVAFFFAVLLPVILGHQLETIFLWMAIFFGARFLIVVVFILRTAWIVSEKLEKGDEHYRIGAQFRYSVPIGASQGLYEFGNIIDKTVISIFFPPSRYAVYSRGAIQVPMLGVIINSMSNVLMPDMVDAYRKNKVDSLLNIWKKSIRLTAVMIYPTFCYIMFMSDIVIPLLFSDKYIESVPIFQLYLLLMIGQVTAYEAIIRVVGKTDVFMRITMVVITLNLVLTVPMVAWLGLAGAPIATLISLYTGRGLFLLNISHLLEKPIAEIFPWLALLKLLLLSGAALLPVVPIKLFLELSSFNLFMLGGVVYGLNYVFFMKITQILDKDDRETLRGVLPSALHWVV